MTAQQDPPATAPAISLVMPTITWGHPFACCLQAALAGLATNDELLVVFDGPPSELPPWLEASAARVLYTGQRSGPAAARNLAAKEARGEILLFVDADVELHPDAVERVRRHFGADPSLQALFGSYDDRPAAAGVVSRFRNLLHHHTHTSQPGPACTFWAGCGAIRRERFLALGGFDAQAYRQPCIEDIEFGLRLHDDGGKILLDPSIQGTHHKRWTLSLMVRTDIQQRAIPWSRLLLSRRQLPATLNLSASARVSAGLSLVLPLALAALSLPLLAPWPLVIAVGAFVLLLAINRSFLALLHRQGGIWLAAPGALLQVLYLLYSSLSFAAVLILDWWSLSLRRPLWLNRRPIWGRRLLWIVVIAMGIYNLYSIYKGSLNAFLDSSDTVWDVNQRYDEWLLFRDKIYPHGSLASDAEKSISYFRTSVYLPWALPIFGSLFAWGGLLQGKIIILIANLAGLIAIAFVGKESFKPWGEAASWLGAFAPLTIRGLDLCLRTGQFSAMCAGLLALQWLLLKRKKTYSAGLSWALAMIKPQIAVTFATLFIAKPHRKGLWLGIGILIGLSIIALWHTSTPPAEFLKSWLLTLSHFANTGSPNLTGLSLSSNNSLKGYFLIASVATVATIIFCVDRRRLEAARVAWARLSSSSLSMELSGISAISGALLFYHHIYDNIMLYPALICCWLISAQRPTLGNVTLSILITLSLSTPYRLLAWLPSNQAFQPSVWLLVGVFLLFRLLSGKAYLSRIAQ